MSVISTFGGMSARGFGLFAGASLLPATSFITVTASTTTNVVPLGYNAVHIQAAVGGGGGSIVGADYDKAGGESAGAGGGSLLKASADNAGGTVTLVTIDSDAGYPLLSISNASSGVLTIATVTPGVSAKNAGTDLAALGVTDSFDGEVPSAALYNLYDLHLMLPKGHGGINGQTSDQEVDLKLYVEAGSAVEAEIAFVLAGLNPSGTGSDELLGQNA